MQAWAREGTIRDEDGVLNVMRTVSATMRIVATEIPDVRIIESVRHSDERGFFAEVYNRRDLAEAGIDPEVVQGNHSLSFLAGTVRGLHYQIAPMAQGKFVRVVRGASFDVALDLRADSPAFGRHVAVELSAENGRELYIPVGFAHGVCTLAPETEVMYKVSEYWSPEHERGIRWDDDALQIPWPVDPPAAVLNDRDREFPLLWDATDLF